MSLLSSALSHSPSWVLKRISASSCALTSPLIVLSLSDRKRCWTARSHSTNSELKMVVGEQYLTGDSPARVAGARPPPRNEQAPFLQSALLEQGEDLLPRIALCAFDSKPSVIFAGPKAVVLRTSVGI